MAYRPFSPEEDEIVRAGYAAAVGAAVMAEKLGRTVDTIMKRARRIGCYKQPVGPDGWRLSSSVKLRAMWMERDDKGREVWPTRRISKHFDRPEAAIHAKAAAEGLPPRKEMPAPNTADAGISWMEAWARKAGAAPERAVEKPDALYAFHPIAIEALDRVFDQRRFAE